MAMWKPWRGCKKCSYSCLDIHLKKRDYCKREKFALAISHPHFLFSTLAFCNSLLKPSQLSLKQLFLTVQMVGCYQIQFHEFLLHI